MKREESMQIKTKIELVSFGTEVRKCKILSPDGFAFSLKCIRLRTQLHKLHFLIPKMPLRIA